jgi:hypothetical protein
VRIGGVVIGRVADISLDEKTYLPRVALDIEERYNQIPDTSSLSIRTSGLLGEQYLALNVGFEDPELGTTILKDGGVIQDTLFMAGAEPVAHKLCLQDRFATRCSDATTGGIHKVAICHYLFH